MDSDLNYNKERWSVNEDASISESSARILSLAEYTLKENYCSVLGEYAEIF